jgi:ribokinase
MKTVILFGDINIDILMSIGPYPEPGEDAMATHVTLRPGGSVANTATVLSKLDIEAKMIGCTGEDVWADLALESLLSSGINVDYVSKKPNYTTGLIFIPVTTNGERTMFSYRGANIQFQPSEISSAIFEDASLLHISGYNFLESPQREATWRSIEIAREMAIPISLDTGVEPAHHARQALMSVLPDLSLLVLGMEEAGALLGAKTVEHAVEGFLAGGIKTVAIKLGREGCTLANDEGSHKSPGYAMKTVDTTGAGDAFCGGILLLANLLGGLATTVWGAGPVLPGAEDVLEYLRNQEQVNTWEEILGTGKDKSG